MDIDVEFIFILFFSRTHSRQPPSVIHSIILDDGGGGNVRREGVKRTSSDFVICFLCFSFSLSCSLLSLLHNFYFYFFSLALVKTFV